ncbi:Dere\GG23524-PA-like protein [Anopheles sinensis]|uniref:Dere\GG23524-PA-like protein n=1 Tax=Anopheles sinensis TaxID=74873 RepID=A0A084VPB6_ANOSI|nr:Dere\GG23524-PA-like protein [Anopheles sinensis]
MTFGDDNKRTHETTPDGLILIIFSPSPSSPSLILRLWGGSRAREHPARHSLIISDVTIGLVTLPSPTGPPAPASFGQRRWRRRPRDGTGRDSTGPPQSLLTSAPAVPPLPVSASTDGKMKYLSAGHRESYTLVARKRYMKRMLYVH